MPLILSTQYHFPIISLFTCKFLHSWYLLKVAKAMKSGLKVQSALDSIIVPGKTREFLSFLPKFPSFSEKKYLTNKKRLGTQLPGSNPSWDLDEMLSRIDVMVNIGKNYYLFYFARYLYLLHIASTKTGRTTAGAKKNIFCNFDKKQDEGFK